MTFPYTITQLTTDHAGQLLRPMHKLGYEHRPVVKFGEYTYVLLHYTFPRPGHNRAEVINVGEFEAYTILPGTQEPDFRILVTTAQRESGSEGWAWVKWDGEGFLSILTTMADGLIHDYPHPGTAVLSWQVVPPTKDDLASVQAELDWQMEEFGPGRNW